MERWEIHQDGVPALRRFCPGCGCERPFVSSGKFRMNANGRRLDVWLIYKCPACGTTWNMEVVARTPVSELSPGRLRAYESNNPAAARAYACDPRLFAHGQAVPVYDEGFRIKKRREAGEEGLLEIRCPENAALRLDKILSSGLGLSREQVKAAIRDGYITGEGRTVSPSTRVNGILRLRVRTGP